MLVAFSTFDEGTFQQEMKEITVLLQIDAPARFYPTCVALTSGAGGCGTA